MLIVVTRSVPMWTFSLNNASYFGICRRVCTIPYGSFSLLSTFTHVGRPACSIPKLKASCHLSKSLPPVESLRFLHSANSRMLTTEQKSSEMDGNKEETKSSQSQRLKLAVREYGATVVVFHTCISLFTLGVSYAAVSSGLDVIGLLSKLGVGQSILESKIATGASTFVIAYAVHKVFAPARMATTLAATPFIVRYLRRVGVLKRPPPKP